MTPDEQWMERCLELARQAGARGEVPVGAPGLTTEHQRTGCLELVCDGERATHRAVEIAR